MEHIIIKDLGNGYYNLTPEDGYMLYNTNNGMTYMEAVTKTPNIYKAVPSPGTAE